MSKNFRKKKWNLLNVDDTMVQCLKRNVEHQLNLTPDFQHGFVEHLWRRPVFLPCDYPIIKRYILVKTNYRKRNNSIIYTNPNLGN